MYPLNTVTGINSCHLRCLHITHQCTRQLAPLSRHSYHSPFFLLYGHEPMLPIDAALHISPGLSLAPSNMELLRRWNTARELVLEREKQTQQSNKWLYDLTRRTNSQWPVTLLTCGCLSGSEAAQQSFFIPFMGTASSDRRRKMTGTTKDVAM